MSLLSYNIWIFDICLTFFKYSSSFQNIFLYKFGLEKGYLSYVSIILKYLDSWCMSCFSNIRQSFKIYFINKFGWEKVFFYICLSCPRIFRIMMSCFSNIRQPFKIHFQINWLSEWMFDICLSCPQIFGFLMYVLLFKYSSTLKNINKNESNSIKPRVI